MEDFSWNYALWQRPLNPSGNHQIPWNLLRKHAKGKGLKTRRDRWFEDLQPAFKEQEGLFLLVVLIGEKNPWNSFFADSEIRTQIRNDVERTFQDKEFFRGFRVKEILQSILFVWDKLNPEISYRQGMNDLAGIIAYNYMKETPHKDYTPTTKYSFLQLIQNPFRSEHLYQFLFQKQHWEADIYILFDALMQNGQKFMYQIDKTKG